MKAVLVVFLCSWAVLLVGVEAQQQEHARKGKRELQAVQVTYGPFSLGAEYGNANYQNSPYSAAPSPYALAPLADLAPATPAYAPINKVPYGAYGAYGAYSPLGYAGYGYPGYRAAPAAPALPAPYGYVAEGYNVGGYPVAAPYDGILTAAVPSY